MILADIFLPDQEIYSAKIILLLKEGDFMKFIISCHIDNASGDFWELIDSESLEEAIEEANGNLESLYTGQVVSISEINNTETFTVINELKLEKKE